MRIALVITELDPGGAENCLTQLACYLATHGNEVRVYAIGPPPVAGQDGLLLQLAKHQIPVEFCITAGGKRSIWGFRRLARWLRACFEKFDPEIVQSMLFHGNLVSALAVDTSRARFFGGVRVRQPEWIRWRLQRWSARKMEKIVCVSDDVARHCMEKERIPSSRIATIPNGIDVAALKHLTAGARKESWAKFGLPSDARVALFVGRLHHQKGVERLVANADRLLDELPEHHLVLIGSGPLESRLRSLAAASKFASRIQLVGWQSDAVAWMQRAELLLLPAEYEGMPNVILEAMAVGLPVVAFDVDGIRQLLGEKADSTLQVVAPNDFDRFIAHATTLLASKPLLAACAQVNRARIAQHFQLHQQLEKYLALYRSPRSGTR